MCNLFNTKFPLWKISGCSEKWFCSRRGSFQLIEGRSNPVIIECQHISDWRVSYIGFWQGQEVSFCAVYSQLISSLTLHFQAINIFPVLNVFYFLFPRPLECFISWVRKWWKKKTEQKQNCKINVLKWKKGVSCLRKTLFFCISKLGKQCCFKITHFFSALLINSHIHPHFLIT